MTNQERKVRPEIFNVNSDEPVFYPYSTKTSKCGDSSNNINDPYAKICIPDVVKNLNIKVFNLMSRTNETKYIKQYKTCKWKCRLDASICNDNQRWNEDKCRCECKELIDKGVWYKGYIQNPGNCECECHKSCDVGEYLDYGNCKCRKRLVNKLVEECHENINEAKIAGTTLMELHSAKHKNVCKSSCTNYVVLIAIALTVNIGIGTYFA